MAPTDLTKLRIYDTMVRIRTFEEEIARILETKPAEIKTPCHLYTGEEAVAAGVCAALRPDDTVYSTHRSHGHYLAKGGDMKTLAAEIWGKATGCSGGKGGSMHICQPETGLPGSCAIVAGTIPLAVGAALAYKHQGKDSVAVSFFGDGAMCEGTLYESLNLAALYRLPVIFVCENNLYSTHMKIDKILAETNIRIKAEAMRVPAQTIDGNNALTVHTAARTVVENARHGAGPALLECLTYRWRGHVGPNYDIDKGLRSQRELDDWMNRDPIKIMENLNVMPQEDIRRTHSKARKEVEEAIDYARQSPHPNPDQTLKGVWRNAGE